MPARKRQSPRSPGAGSVHTSIIVCGERRYVNLSYSRPLFKWGLLPNPAYRPSHLPQRSFLLSEVTVILGVTPERSIVIRDQIWRDFLLLY